MTFDYLALRFCFQARDAIRFDAGRTANRFRGQLGAALCRVAPEAYSRIFQAGGSGPGPSGLADQPRPFVLRVRHLYGAVVAAGGNFTVGLNLFDNREPWTDWLAAAMESAGFGRLDRVDTATGSVPLDPEPGAPPRAVVHFLTPTELKPINEPDFEVVLSRARDRVSTLSALYGPGPLAIDFRGMGERAARVRTVRTDVRMEDVVRRSSRSGQVHSIGGFTGTAEYEGDLHEFLPYLRAAAVTGVGRHTVWGNGELAVEPEASSPSPGAADTRTADLPPDSRR